MLAAVQAQESAALAAGRHIARAAARFGAAAALCGWLALLAVLAGAAGRPPSRIVTAAFVVVALFEAAVALPRAGVLAGYAVASARRVLRAAEAPAPVADPARPAALPAASSLRFEAVRFGWAPDRPVLDGLTMDIPAGGRVALLGPSGAGKSTCAALALKVAAPDAGRVLLGGVDIATLRASDVRARIAWLGQTSHLFADTIRHNLLLARPEADDAALWAALEAARVADVVRGLPEGLDAWLGEGGTGLSGGQRRRVALARALLSPAPILLLDEPCAGLDAQTERAFLVTLNEVAQGRAVLLIVHRLTGVERLDRIYRLSAGRAVAAAG
jgi:ATP-binding cassette subfamily C protein CydC